MNSKNCIDLLGKVLNTDSSVEISEKLEAAINNFCSIYENEFEPFIENSKIVGLAEYTEKIHYALKDLDILVFFPELIGKTTIGFLNLAGDKIKSWITPFIGSKDFSLASKSGSTPVILSQGVDYSILAVNDCKSMVCLTENEYIFINKELWKQNVCAERLVKAYKIKSLDSNIDDLVISYFPYYMDIHEPFIDELISFQDSLFLFVDNDIERLSFIKRIIEKWKELIPIYIVTEDISLEIIKKRYQDDSIEIIDVSQLNNCIQSQRAKRINVFLGAAIKNIISNMMLQYSNRLEKLDNSIKHSTADLVSGENKELKHVIKSTLSKLETDCAQISSEVIQLKQIADKMQDAADKIDNILQNVLTLDFKSGEKRARYFREMCLQHLEHGKITNALEVLKILELEKDRYYYALAMILNKKKGQSLNQYNVKQLENEKNTLLIRHIKMELGERIGMDESELRELSHSIRKKISAKEYYYDAEWFLMHKNQVEGEKLLIQSYFMGHEKAGERLVELAFHDRDEKKFDVLAKLLIPKANYYKAHRMSGSHASFYRMRQLKFAAAKGYLPAIWDVTEILADRVIRNHCSDEKNIDIVKKLSLFLLEKDSNNERRYDLEEKIGIILKEEGQVLRAVEHLKKSNTKKALCELGKIYMYGKEDVSKNLSLAIRYFEEAKNKGALTQKYIDTINEWIKSEKMKKEEENTYKKEKSYSSSSYTENYSGGGCFITSAVCEFLHKPDDCKELNVMREYRDKEGERDIRIRKLIEEYYRIAPEIVSKIDEDENREEVYKLLWTDYIANIYEAIINGKRNKALHMYIEMTLVLSKQYNVSITGEIYSLAKVFLEK